MTPSGAETRRWPARGRRGQRRQEVQDRHVSKPVVFEISLDGHHWAIPCLEADRVSLDLDIPQVVEYHTEYAHKTGPAMSVRHALLALLSEGPKYGLQLRQEFEARTGEVWPLNVGQVYTTLQRLERDGLVESEGDVEEGPQKGFRLTPDGEVELASWLRTPPDLSAPPRDELVIKVMVALHMPGADVHEVIQVHRRYLVELMQQWTHLKEDEAEFDLGFALVVDAELFRLDALVRWLDAADGRIKRTALEPPVPQPFPLPKLRRRVGVRP